VTRACWRNSSVCISRSGRVPNPIRCRCPASRNTASRPPATPGPSIDRPIPDDPPFISADRTERALAPTHGLNAVPGRDE
jgi:hypothetical protein